MTDFQRKLILMVYNDLQCLNVNIRDRMMTPEDFEQERQLISDMDELLLNLMKKPNDQTRSNLSPSR